MPGHLGPLPSKVACRAVGQHTLQVLPCRWARRGDFAAAGWRAPEAGLLAGQHEAFGQLLTDLGCEVEVAPAASGLVDATYVRDPGLVTGAGAVLFQMVKPARWAEPALLGAALAAAGVPVVARLAGAARADGGDFIWLDQRTMLAGRSYRTNAEGLRQLAQILAAEGASLVPVDLPHDRGPGHVLHLMSLISPVAGDVAVVYPPLAPVALMQTLAERGVRVVPVDYGEYETMGCNVLAVEPASAGRTGMPADGTPQRPVPGACCRCACIVLPVHQNQPDSPARPQVVSRVTPPECRPHPAAKSRSSATSSGKVVPSPCVPARRQKRSTLDSA